MIQKKRERLSVENKEEVEQAKRIWRTMACRSCLYDKTDWGIAKNTTAKPSG